MSTMYDGIIGIDVTGRQLALDRLMMELDAAGIPHRALGIVDNRLHTYDENGYPIDLPAEAQPVVDAHIPDVLPASQFEQLASAIAQANEQTAAVATLDQMKGVVTQLYANLGAILLASEGPPP